MKGYYFITDSGLSRAGSVADVRAAVETGVSVVQYRNKDGETRALYEEAKILRELCRGTGTRFIVNDRIDIALAVDADGVHIGQEDMPYREARRLMGHGKIIGVSVHTLELAKEAERDGADYLGVGPVFPTATKPDALAPTGVSLVREVKAVVSIPVAAIAGISLENVDEVINAGADMVCAISAVVAGENVKEEIMKFQRKYLR